MSSSGGGALIADLCVWGVNSSDWHCYIDICVVDTDA